MRVGLPLKYSALPECGGGYTFESAILEALTELGTESRHTFVLLAEGDAPPSPVAPGGPVPVLPLPGSGKGASAPAARRSGALLRKVLGPAGFFLKDGGPDRRCAAFLAENGIDLVWSLGPGCLTPEVPYITTVWDLQHRLQPYFPEVSGDGQWEIRESYHGTVLRRAALVFTGTGEGKAEIERFYQVPSDRIRVLPLPTPGFALGAGPSAADGELLARYGLSPDYLFYPSQLWPHKNHVGLLQALRILRDRYGLAVPLVLAGGDQGNRRHVEETAADLGLTGQVRFLGFVPREDLVALYRNAFALVFASFFGPDNIPPLEAFALGCPVIAARVPGADEQLGDAALLVDPGDEESIARAVTSLRDDPALRCTLIERGLARAARWTGRDYVRSVFAILDAFEPIRRCWPHSGAGRGEGGRR